MSWGVKIALLYTSFVALIVTMVSLSMRENVDLVTKDYYEQELNFQKKIDKLNRSTALAVPLKWEVKAGEIVFDFPKEFKAQSINGTVYFFRPSDATLDKTVTIPVDTLTNKKISTTHFKKGLYQMQINWQVDKEEYYNEGFIQIN